MKRTGESTIEITDDEMLQIYEFIHRSLDQAWDRYTDNFICTDSWEDGKQRMDPEMYDLANKLISL